MAPGTSQKLSKEINPLDKLDGAIKQQNTLSHMACDTEYISKGREKGARINWNKNRR